MYIDIYICIYIYLSIYIYIFIHISTHIRHVCQPSSRRRQSTRLLHQPHSLFAPGHALDYGSGFGALFMVRQATLFTSLVVDFVSEEASQADSSNTLA